MFQSKMIITSDPERIVKDTANQIGLWVDRITNERLKSGVEDVLGINGMSHNREQRNGMLETFLHSCLSEQFFNVRKIAVMIASLDGQITQDSGRNSDDYPKLHQIQDLLIPFVIHPTTKRDIVQQVEAGQTVICKCTALIIGAAAVVGDGHGKVKFTLSDSGKIIAKDSLSFVPLPLMNPAPNNRAYAIILDLADQTAAGLGDEVFSKSPDGEISDEDLRKAGHLLATRLGSTVYFCVVKLPALDAEREDLVTIFSHIRALVPNLLFFEAYTSSQSRTKAPEEVVLKILSDRFGAGK